LRDRLGEAPDGLRVMDTVRHAVIAVNHYRVDDLPELRARIKTVVDYLATFKREDFAGAEERAVTYPFFGGKSIRGGDYLDHMVLPNFHFHLTTAYSILRHNGVDLGKGDFLGELPLV